MRNRQTLTKSLHTVSAVVNLALHLMQGRAVTKTDTPEAFVAAALTILGQPGPWPADDETVAACVKQLTKRLAKGA